MFGITEKECENIPAIQMALLVSPEHIHVQVLFLLLTNKIMHRKNLFIEVKSQFGWIVIISSSLKRKK